MSPSRSVSVRGLRAVALCVIAVGATACGDPGPAPEITSGTAPTAQQPVALRDYEPQSVADGEEWPRACDLITRDEVLAVLPQATELELEGDEGDFDYKLVALGGYSVAQPTNRYARARHISIPEQVCDINLRLPSADEEEGAYVKVKVKIDMVGSPDTVRYFWSPTSTSPMPDQFGAEECVEHVSDPESSNLSTFQCRKGRMAIEVIGIFTLHDEMRVRLAGQPADTPPTQVYEWYRTRIMPQFVGVAARRMPQGPS